MKGGGGTKERGERVKEQMGGGGRRGKAGKSGIVPMKRNVTTYACLHDISSILAAIIGIVFSFPIKTGYSQR